MGSVKEGQLSIKHPSEQVLPPDDPEVTWLPISLEDLKRWRRDPG